MEKEVGGGEGWRQRCVQLLFLPPESSPNSSAQPKFMYTKGNVKQALGIKSWVVFHKLLNDFYSFRNKSKKKNSFPQWGFYLHRHVMHINKVYSRSDWLILDLTVGLCVRNTASRAVVAATLWEVGRMMHCK
jgi:hypothetical protein